MTTVEDVKGQLLRRFSLIDVLAKSVFRVQVYYTGIVYVPKMPKDTAAESRTSLP
jgi:hypothetical protein